MDIVTKLIDKDTVHLTVENQSIILRFGLNVENNKFLWPHDDLLVHMYCDPEIRLSRPTTDMNLDDLQITISKGRSGDVSAGIGVITFTSGVGKNTDISQPAVQWSPHQTDDGKFYYRLQIPVHLLKPDGNNISVMPLRWDGVSEIHGLGALRAEIGYEKKGFQLEYSKTWKRDDTTVSKEPKLGALYNVTALPPYFLGRSNELDTLRDMVITKDENLTHVRTENRITIVEGLGGIGKSVFAASFAYDRVVRLAFPDGIIWLTVGRKPNMYEQYRTIGIALGDDQRNYQDETSARQNAQKILSAKKCLLILDDVWELSVAQAFRDLIPDTPVRMLITTRSLHINDVLNANEYRLKLIDESQAVHYLHSWVGNDPDLKTVASELGYLFLALKLAGARMRKDNLNAKEYLSIFNRISRMKINRLSHSRDDNLEVSIMLSVEAAFEGIEHMEDLYYAFGIFEEDTFIPYELTIQLWQYLYPDIEEFDLLEILNSLIDLQLIDKNAYDSKLSLHDLLLKFTREKLGTRYPTFHTNLLESYKLNEWHKLSRNDPYLWENLAYHLIEANRLEELVLLLTKSAVWMNIKKDIFRTDQSYLADVGLALESFYRKDWGEQDIYLGTILFTTKHMIAARNAGYGNEYLKILTCLGKDEDALALVHLRVGFRERFYGYFKIYNTLLSLQKSNEHLLNHIIEAAQQVPVIDRDDALSQTVDILLKHKNFDSVAMLIDKIIVVWRKSQEQEKLAIAYIQDGMNSQALKLIPEIHAPLNRNNAREYYVRKQMEFLDFRQALEIADTITDVEKQSMLLGKIAEEQIKAENLDDAFNTISTIKTPKTRNQNLLHLCKAYSDVGNTGGAKDALRAMDTDADQLNSSIRAIANSLIKQEKFDEALAILPINHQNKQDRLIKEEVLEFLAYRIVITHESVNNTWILTKVDDRLHDAIYAGFARGNLALSRIPQAYDDLSNISEDRILERLVDMLIRKLVQNGEFEDAIGFALKLSARLKQNLLIYIIRELMDRKIYETAERLVVEIENLSQRSSILSEIIQGQVIIKYLDKAFEKIEDNPNTEEQKQIRQIITHNINSIYRLPYLLSNPSASITSLLQEYIKQNEKLSWDTKLMPTSIKQFYVVFDKLLGKDLNSANNYFENNMPLFIKNRDFRVISNLHSSLEDMLTNNDSDEIFTYLDLCINRPYNLISQARYVDEYRANNAIDTIIDLLEIEQFDRVEEIIDNIKDIWVSIPAKSYLAMGFAFNGKMQQANAIISELIDSVDDIHQMNVRKDALHNISVALAYLGDFKTALSMLEEFALDDYLVTMSTWRDSFARHVVSIHPNQFLQEIIRIGGVVYEDMLQFTLHREYS